MVGFASWPFGRSPRADDRRVLGEADMVL